MKNKTHKRKLNKILLFMLIVVVIIICIILLSKRKVENINTQQIAKIQMSNYSIQVGANNTEIDFDKTIAKTREEINAPRLGAGMIPIIDLGNGMYEITTKEDTNWYDYSNNKPAYMMLSDKKYVSELQVDMTNKELAKNKIQLPEADLGTVYIWIPRFVNCENNIGFLKETGIINAGNWSTPEIFTYQTTNENYNSELTGIWLEKAPQTSSSNTDTKVNQMNIEENIYGIISNEKVLKLDEDVKKQLEVFNKCFNLEDYINDYTNNNRTYINVINTNLKTELVARADMVGRKVKITIVNNAYEIDKIIHVTSGQVIENNEYETQKAGGFYPFIVIDKKGNMVTCTAGYEENPPDLTGFRVDSTYIVTYSGEINQGTATEISKQPILEVLADGYELSENNTLIKGDIDFSKVDESRGKWYDYAEQKWANIVVRNNGNEAYFVWIPRYAYIANNETQTTDVVFIDTDNIQPRTGKEVDTNRYTIPEAFTWINEDGETVQLPGYWIGKYQLSSFATFGLTADVYNGVNLIRLTNIRNNVVSNNNARYEITLKKDGEVIKKVENANADLCEFSEATGNKLTGGIYEILIVLYDERGYYRGETTLTADVYEQTNQDTPPNPPDLTGFRVDTTYIVTYSGEINQGTATETSNQPISEILKEGYKVNEDNTLKEGEIDFSKIKGEWYNYSEQKWANIVVRNEGNEAYFVWIPRYEYHAYGTQQETDVYFISTEQDKANYGYTIPEAFTWQDDEGKTVQLSGYWIGKYQLSSFTTFGLKADVYNGVNLIRLTNIKNNIISNSNATYDITLKKDGEVIKEVKGANPTLCEFSEKTGTKLEAGEYQILIVVYDERGYYRGEITLTAEVYVQNNIDREPNPPDLTGFNRSITYYVTYDEAGNEVLTPITQSAPENWYNYEEQKWANIVVKNEDVNKVAYFVWIPRYEYHAYSDEEVTDVYFIPTEQAEPTYGYTIPEAFTWQDEEGNTVQLSGYWIGKYQLSN